MTTIINLPTPLKDRTGGRDEVEVSGATVGQCLEALERDYPMLEGWILDDRGQIRQHVSVFVGGAKAPLDQRLDDDDEIYVLQAISGGAPDSADRSELLVGTKKGLIVLHGPRGEPMDTVGRMFPGQVVEYAMRDPRTGLYYASVTHGQFGPHVYVAPDPVGEWEQVDGPAFPPGIDASIDRV